MLKIKGVNTGDKLIIFDLDDTLVTTDAKIKIVDRHTGKVIKEMSPQEFNTFETQSKRHVLNFEDFLSPEILRQGKFIKEIFSKLKSYYKKGIPVSIVTARSSSDLIRNFFLENGIDIHPQLVIAVNDPQYEYTGTIASKKLQAIQDLIDLGFKNLTFFDDSEDNLRLAKEAEGYKEATIKLIKVD
jgi:hydroxymethylpyrimidine pyrophosphatase-like HAD family hydrolase